MHALGVLKIGLLTLLAKLTIIPESVADEAALEFLRRYGPLEEGTDVGYDEDMFECAALADFERIPSDEYPGLNVFGTPLKL